MDPTLPHDDRDARLARRLGALLDEGASLDAAAPDDAAYRALLSYKEDQAAEADDARANRVWAALEQQMETMRPAGAPAERAARLPARIYRLRPVTRWVAAAASVLLLVAFGWWLVQREAGLVLLAAAEAETVHFTADDGSVIALRPHSRLYRLEGEEAAARYQLEGEGYFDVVHDPSRIVEVVAGAGVVTVLGTEFNVSTWGEETVVYLQEGRVQFASRARAEDVVLEPGEVSRLTAAGQITEPEPAPAGVFVDWLGDELLFEAAPLARVLAELEHHYAVRVEASDALLEETVSGPVPLGDAETSLRVLADVLGARLEADGPAQYRLTP